MHKAPVPGIFPFLVLVEKKKERYIFLEETKISGFPTLLLLLLPSSDRSCSQSCAFRREREGEKGALAGFFIVEQIPSAASTNHPTILLDINGYYSQSSYRLTLFSNSSVPILDTVLSGNLVGPYSSSQPE